MFSIHKHDSTVGFHNFNLRIFNLRVSNPDKLIVDVCLTRCRIPVRQGLGPEKHDEISETDRNNSKNKNNSNNRFVYYLFIMLHVLI